MIERSRRVVLLIDYDNLQICASRDTPGRELQLPPVVQLAQRYGTVILARAYAEWNLSTERLAVYKAGIEPAFAPVLRTESDRSGKSLADTVMVAEGMDMLWTLSPDVVVLATSDKDLIPLVRVAKQRGAFVVVLGSDFTAIPLREMADDHVTYRQLITDGSGRLTDAGATRQPAALAEPARHRTRERSTGRERTAAPATAAVSPVIRPEREASVALPPPASTSPLSTPAPTSTPTPTAVPGFGSVGSPVEPVASVMGGVGGDADTQPGTRRRRRRGSRRRSERVGMPGESMPFGEGTGDADAFSSDDASDGDMDSMTSSADVALASSGTVEASFDELPFEASPLEELVGELIEAQAEAQAAVESAVETPAPFQPAEAEGETEAVVDAVPAPRDRRRRTRRPATDIVTAAASETMPLPDADASLASAPLADMLAGAESVASENGVDSADSPDRADEDVSPAPRAVRPRRVASASRGRRTR